MRAALDAGAFDSFHFPDGMISVNLEDNFGSEIDGSTGQHPGTDSPGAAAVADMGKANGFDGTSPFAPESYDAAALLILAMQAAGSSASADLKDKVMEVANAPGEKIYPGELAKALKILADGGDVERAGPASNDDPYWDMVDMLGCREPFIKTTELTEGLQEFRTQRVHTKQKQ